MSDVFERAEAAIKRAEAGLLALIGTMERYGQHDANCDAVQPMWHKGPCDCGWTAACKLLGIDEESAGMPEDTTSAKTRYSGARRVDISAVPELAALMPKPGCPDGWRALADARGKWLVERGYRQINRRYLTVARLPEGMTGQQALRSAFNGDRDAEWIDKLADEQAGNHFRRVYAYYTGAPLVLELDRETYSAFLAAGGKEAF